MTLIGKEEEKKKLSVIIKQIKLHCRLETNIRHSHLFESLNRFLVVIEIDLLPSLKTRLPI
jgi:hypothetical protein